jgi:predicted GNAT superfamily acetyltransferase
VDALTIHPAQNQDFEPVLAINEAGRPGVSFLTLAELAAICAGGSHCHVAKLDREIVGYVIIYTDTDSYDGEEFNWFKLNFARFLYIDQIAIARSARGAGVGAHIYRLLEQRARGRALTSLVCEVNLDPPNPVSLAFHARQCFVEVETLATADGRMVSLQRKELGQHNLH